MVSLLEGTIGVIGDNPIITVFGHYKGPLPFLVTLCPPIVTNPRRLGDNPVLDGVALIIGVGNGGPSDTDAFMLCGFPPCIGIDRILWWRE